MAVSWAPGQGSKVHQVRGISGFLPGAIMPLRGSSGHAQPQAPPTSTSWMGLKSSEICPCPVLQLALFQSTRTPGCLSVQLTEHETVGLQAQQDSPLLTEGRKDPPLQLNVKTDTQDTLGVQGCLSVHKLIHKNPVLDISCHTAQHLCLAFSLGTSSQFLHPPAVGTGAVLVSASTLARSHLTRMCGVLVQAAPLLRRLGTVPSCSLALNQPDNYDG